MLWVIVLVRCVGLRSFSKMTNFDFVATVATGSLLAGASQAEAGPALLQALTAMGVLLAIQFVTAKLRKRSTAFQHLVQNQPLILMRDGVIDDRALDQSRVARSDLIAKLREANVRDLGQVRAVVLETTGDISVLRGDRLDAQLLEGTHPSS